MATMKSNEKFRYYLNQYLIPMFKLLYIEATEGKILNRIGYYIILGFLIISIFAALNGIYIIASDADADSTMILVVGCGLLGTVQVIKDLL